MDEEFAEPGIRGEATMPRNLDDLIAHGDELAAMFESADPATFREPSTRSKLAHAAMRRAAAERDLRSTVVASRAEGLSWAEVGKILGVSGEAARKRYGRAAEEVPGADAAEVPSNDERKNAAPVLEELVESNLSAGTSGVVAQFGPDERRTIVALIVAEQAATTRRLASALEVDVPDDASSLL